MSAHYVYRCYDSDDRLLYIGLTRDIGARMSAHRNDLKHTASCWLRPTMVRYELLGPFPSWTVAHRVESCAIVVEQPVFNQSHRLIPKADIVASIVDYLTSKGHDDLALALTESASVKRAS